MSGPHFRDYHLLLDEHGDQIFAMTDDIAERVRKIGGITIRSIGHIARLSASPTTTPTLSPHPIC
jgi:starvation-inducible DNA-binding protein